MSPNVSHGGRQFVNPLTVIEGAKSAETIGTRIALFVEEELLQVMVVSGFILGFIIVGLFFSMVSSSPKPH
jgi:hypothetical protein